jgi:hypothetical protein
MNPHDKRSIEEKFGEHSTAYLVNKVLQPNILFKFHNDNPYLENLLRENKLFYTNYLRFNDPFELRYKLKRIPKKQIHDFYFAFSLSVKRRVSGQELYPMIEDIFKDMLGEIGIVCLTAIPDNILMWAHYANCHQGVCLMFDVTKDKMFTRVNPIIYSDSIAEVDISKYILEETVKIITTKSAHWKYELEWRGVKIDGEGAYSFEAEALAGIIFGAKMEQSRKAYYAGLIKELGLKIRLYEAELSNHLYKINLREYKTGKKISIDYSRVSHLLQQ